jgi:hypothetical protein
MKNVLLITLVFIAICVNISAQRPYNSSGNWLELDGIDDYASIENTPALDIGVGTTDDFTIECFFYLPNSVNEGIQIIMIKGGSYFLYLLLKDTEQDRIIFIIYTTIVKDYLGLIHYVDLLEGWHHLAASFDNEYTDDWDAMQIFLDGERVENATNFEITPGIWNSTEPFCVGANLGANPFQGRIDEVRISDIVRYDSLYTVPESDFIVDDNTRALWHFNESLGSTSFNDCTKNGNNLTGLNGAQTLSDDYTDVPHGELNNNQKPEFTVIYSNPANGGVFILKNESQDKFEIAIYNINGQILYRNNISRNSTKQIDLSYKQQGIYLLRIYNDRFNKIEKFIID